MKRDVLQVSIAAAIARSRFRREEQMTFRGSDEAALQNYTESARQDMMAAAAAVIDELVKLNVLKGVK